MKTQLPRVSYDAIERAIVKEGVTWHDCNECWRPWPFPRGFHVDREWRCHVCVQRIWAELQRVTIARSLACEA